MALQAAVKDVGDERPDTRTRGANRSAGNRRRDGRKTKGGIAAAFSCTAEEIMA